MTTKAKRVAQMGATADKLSSYTGLAKQLVVNKDTWRVHVMDGALAGGYALARLDDIPAATDLSGYLLKTEAANTYATKSTTYTKPEIDEKLKNVSTDDHAVLIQQYIAFYNGYMGTNLDYREYLSCNNNEAVNQLYAFANAYKG